MTTVGAIFRPQFPPEQALAVALAADEAGLAELWLWEDCFRQSGIATAAAMLGATERVRIGVGLLPVPLRNVALTAMELATLERMFPARFIPGLGHGVLPWMGQVGARVGSPLTLLSEYVTALRRLLDGERVSTTGRYVKLDDVALDWPPATRAPLLIGAEGPKTLQLSGALGDATIITSGTTPAMLRAALVDVRTGREQAGRTDPAKAVVFLMAATGDDAHGRMTREIDAWGITDRGHVSVAGSAADIAAGIAKWVEAGADTVLLQPTADEPDPIGFVRFTALEVAPLLA